MTSNFYNTVESVCELSGGSLRPTDQSKRNKATQSRRPRTFPTAMRQKLARLGQRLDNETTSQANLKILIGKLTSDLELYQLEAKHWQDQCLAITGLEESKPSTKSPVERQADSDLRSSTPCGNIVTAFNCELIGKLQSTANPTLSLCHLSLPFFRSTPGIATQETSFKIVLTAVDSLAQLFDKAKQPEVMAWSNIRRLKPDFSAEKARKVWGDIFSPISIDPARLCFDSAPASRYEGYLLGEDDPDLDHMDRLLLGATDLEVIDLLHYCSLFLSGMYQPVFEHSDLKRDRDHLGRTLERLLREAMIARNITLNASLAQSLLDGGMSHFAAADMSPLISVAEIAWQILTQHPTMVHPVSLSYVTLLNTIIAPTPGRRAKSVARTMELLQTTTERYFQLDLITYYTSAYYALLIKDQDSLLHYLDLLDSLLVSGPLDELADDASFSDPTFAPWDTSSYHAPALCYQPSSSSSTAPSPSPSTFTHSSSGDENHLVETASMWRMAKFFDTLPSSSSVDSELQADPAKVKRNSGVWTSETGAAFIPSEKLKRLFRISVILLRAEASLAFGDEETCRKWVDEAEKTLQTLPMIYSPWKAFLFKGAIKTTCTFPSGTHTVVDEFEKRSNQYDIERMELYDYFSPTSNASSLESS